MQRELVGAVHSFVSRFAAVGWDPCHPDLIIQPTQGVCAGMPGMPEMSEQELMRETIQTGGISVLPGNIWRKEDTKKAKSGRGSLAELVNLTLGAQIVQAKTCVALH